MFEKFGLGRIGELPQEIPLETFVEQVKKVFQLEGLRIVQPQKTKSSIKRIAICGGSGEKFYPQAIAQRATCLYHRRHLLSMAHDMQSAGLIAIYPGHYIESLCKERFIEKFETGNKKKIGILTFSVSETNTNPFRI